jgi:hypothetical protein
MPVTLELRFTNRPNGTIGIMVPSAKNVFNTALDDAVSTLAPRGALVGGLSTYWIDRATEGALNSQAAGSTEPFASGNVTYLRVDGQRVVAAYDFDPDEKDAASLPFGDFLALLSEWRLRVVDALNVREGVRVATRLTEVLRHDNGALAIGVRDALRGRSVDPDSSVVADFCPESASLENGADVERHLVVIVDAERAAFIGMFERSATTARFVTWRKVPSSPIADRDEIIALMSKNRRNGLSWDTGIDPSISDPREVLYNRLIETALIVLDGKQP